MRNKDKKDIFFDLDHTLWDFDRNAAETLAELFDHYRFHALGIESAGRFIEVYNRNNHRLWALYHHGKITKAQLRAARFADTFTELGIDPARFPETFETDYLRLCPQKTHLFPETHETLGHLREKYTLHLISNGFRDAAEVKISTCKLKNYFSTIVISEVVGVHKPHPEIFHYAVSNAKTSIDCSVMVGDNLDADIRGAQQVGMDAVFFNPRQTSVPADVPYAVASLAELRDLL